MKKITLFAFLLVCFWGQAQNYSFLKTTATYSDLQNPISISNGEVWDDPEYPVFLPFDFTVSNAITNTLFVNDSYIAFVTTDNFVHVVSPFGNDLIDRGGDTSYKIDGNVGSRVAKIEFKNCGSFDDNSLTMFVNFQIWLYETTNVIEFRYGASSVTSPEDFYDGETGGLVAVAILDSLEEETLEGSLFLAGLASNPTLTTAFTNLNGTPENGTVYRFTPTTLSTENHDLDNFALYPNPTADILNFGIDTLGLDYTIRDMTGKTIQEGILNQPILDVKSLQSGMYFIRIENYKTQKFVKK